MPPEFELLGACACFVWGIKLRYMSITATVENDTIRLPLGMHIPDGTQVVIETVERAGDSSSDSLARCLAEYAGIADDLPSDLAANLDHYLHGHPKRQRPFSATLSTGLRC